MAHVDYASNLAQRTLCMLVLDASASMQAKESNGISRIEMLNQGLVALQEALQSDPIALSRVQVAVVNVGGPTDTPELILDWTDAGVFRPFRMVAGNNTPLGRGTMLALDAIEAQKARLRSYGISYTRPWVLVLTDGEPTDDTATWAAACNKVRASESSGKVQVYPVLVGNVSIGRLGELSRTVPMRMNTLRFRELFVWLSASMSQISRSAPGQTVPLPPTDPWAAVKL